MARGRRVLRSPGRNSRASAGETDGAPAQREPGRPGVKREKTQPATAWPSYSWSWTTCCLLNWFSWARKLEFADLCVIELENDPTQNATSLVFHSESVRSWTRKMVAGYLAFTCEPRSGLSIGYIFLSRRGEFYQEKSWEEVNISKQLCMFLWTYLQTVDVWKRCLMAQLIQRDQRRKRQGCIWRGWGWRSTSRPLAAPLVIPRAR